LAFVGRVVADDGVSFACSCLSICEDSGVNALEKLPNGIFDQVENIFLIGFRREDIVKFHIRMITGPSDL
jgi:hypothetical protein